jgi:hypothetical protein
VLGARARHSAIAAAAATRPAVALLARRAEAFLAWWLAMGGIVFATFALALALCALF